MSKNERKRPQNELTEGAKPHFAAGNNKKKQSRKVSCFVSSAEDEGGQPGRVEEHPRASSLGGFPGIPGSAAESTAGPAELREWAEPLVSLGAAHFTSPLHLLVADGPRCEQNQPAGGASAPLHCQTASRGRGGDDIYDQPVFL